MWMAVIRMVDVVGSVGMSLSCGRSWRLVLVATLLLPMCSGWQRWTTVGMGGGAAATGGGHAGGGQIFHILIR